MTEGGRDDRGRRPHFRRTRLAAVLLVLYGVLRAVVWGGGWVLSAAIIAIGVVLFLSTIEPTRRILR
jgi:fatty acid desaturase